MVIPKPLCQCRICRQARDKGVPYARAGPSSFLHDINLLIDTPAEIGADTYCIDGFHAVRVLDAFQEAKA